MRVFALLLLILVYCTSCCKEKLNKTLNFGSFELTVPQNWNYEELEGDDTFFGKIKACDDELFFDYGWGYNFENITDLSEDEGTISFEALIIDGASAKIIKETHGSKVRYSLFVTKKNVGQNWIYGFDLKNEDLAREVFLTHKFKNP